MKKRTICKLLAFALTLALVFPLSVAAAESTDEITTGTYSWTSGNYTYIASVIPGSSSEIKVALATADHTIGYSTTMYITTNNVVTVHATTEEFNTSYRNELIQALNDSGLQDSCSYYPPQQCELYDSCVCLQRRICLSYSV